MERPLIQDFRALWDWRGRAPRRQYWLAVTFCIVATGLGVGLALGLVLAGVEALGSIVLIVLVLAGCIPLGMATMRRLQDRDRKPAWILLITAPNIVSALIDGLGVGQGVQTAAFFLVGLPVWAWSIVELGFLPGTRGRNRFGDDPLQPPPADAF